MVQPGHPLARPLETSMVDLVLVVFTGAVFCAGFWLGAKHGTFSAAAKSAKATVKGWF